MFLKTIVEKKRVEIDFLKHQACFTPRSRPHHSLIQRLDANPSLGVIAEIKRGSPSRGHFAPDLDIVDTAQIYKTQGASAISVLTDSHFFGSYADLAQVAQAVDLPLLAKDFMLDPIQLNRAYSMGADLVLLIAAILTREEILSLTDTAQQLGLEVLVELHTAEDAEKVTGLDIPLLGINHRDLHSFNTSLDVSRQLIPALNTRHCHLIAESGLHTPEDVQSMADRGFSGILVGESLIRAQETGTLLEAMAAVPKVRLSGKEPL